MMNFASVIAAELSIAQTQVKAALALIDDGGTVPFIARYRKEATGNLDEIQIRDILHRYEYFKELSDRRATVMKSIAEQGKLTPELSVKIEAALSKTELEDLYLPFKPKRTTRAIRAREAGLEPLKLWLADCSLSTADPESEAAKYLNPEKGIDTASKALQGACDIFAEEIADDAEVRKWLRNLACADGVIVSRVRPESEKQKTKFSMYYDYKEPVKTLPSHRILAMLRGEREAVLSLSLEFPLERAAGYIAGRFIKFPAAATHALLSTAITDALDRLLGPATETEIRVMLRDRADEAAFKVFGENLRNLLLSPPAGRKPVLAFDPGFRTGCKLVVLDDTGKFLEYQTIFPHEPANDVEGSRAVVMALIQRHKVKLIAIGNGTASRETDAFVRETLALIPEEFRPVSVMVNESGASVYSASDIAIREFPDQDITVRGSVSIGRRLQDPLSELVKIDPKAIGVGQYQHDVNQSLLRKRLDEEVESCVNYVGVEINLASEELLKHVAGLTRTTASRIVKHRDAHGAFSSRQDLLKVAGLGPKTYEQAAAFLRIPGAANPLDNSAVHPERYAIVNAMAESLKLSIPELIGNHAALAKISTEQFVSDSVGLPTLVDILRELEKPGRDPREEFRNAHFIDAVTKISDLKKGMLLEGTVTNVTAFGAFVDIGVHQDGLVHISELADRFIADPHQAVRVGQVVKVRVLSADTELKRIALSMKSPAAPAAPAPARPARAEKKPAERSRHDTPQTRRQSAPPAKPQPAAAPRKPAPPPRPHFSAADLAKKFNTGDQNKKKLVTVKPKFNIKNIMN